MTDAFDDEWFVKYWRPAMAWQYLVVCVFDFLLFPIVHVVVQFLLHEPTTEWHPITLQFGGFYHFTMATIIGLYTIGRTVEKVQSINKSTETTPSQENKP